MGRRPCCEETGLKRGPWDIEEDQKLVNCILANGIKCWRAVPKLAGLLRCGKSCRLRWMNYLRPDVKRGPLTEAEEDQIIELHSRLGNRWSKIAAHFPGRTDNEIKNHWNTRIKKKLKLLGIVPQTHKPIGQVHEDCEIKESEPVKEQREAGKEEHKLLQISGSNQLDHSCSDQKASSVHKTEAFNEDLDSGSILTPHTEQSDSMYELVLQEYSHEHWIDSVNSFFSWDGLSNLEEIFPFDNH